MDDNFSTDIDDLPDFEETPDVSEKPRKRVRFADEDIIHPCPQPKPSLYKSFQYTSLVFIMLLLVLQYELRETLLFLLQQTYIGSFSKIILALILSAIFFVFQYFII
jgi:hypothetical protein